MENKSMTTNSLEITVISAEGLRFPSRSVKKSSVFVTVATGPSNTLSTREAADRGGGSSPSWNEKLLLLLPPSAGSVTVEVHCRGASGTTSVGSAIVPLSDIVDGYVPPYLVHFLSYRLRERDGQRNGIINLAVKMVGPDWIRRSVVSPESRKMQMCASGVAIGIPVGMGFDKHM